MARVLSMNLSNFINVIKLNELIIKQGCSSALLSAKDMAYDLASENHAKQKIASLYGIYNELAEGELNSFKVVSAIERFIEELHSDDAKQRFISYLYPCLKK
jgi:hypothetical protein